MDEDRDRSERMRLITWFCWLFLFLVGGGVGLLPSFWLAPNSDIAHFLAPLVLLFALFVSTICWQMMWDVTLMQRVGRWWHYELDEPDLKPVQREERRRGMVFIPICAVIAFAGGLLIALNSDGVPAPMAALVYGALGIAYGVAAYVLS
jgi:hypothetical protein